MIRTDLLVFSDKAVVSGSDPPRPQPYSSSPETPIPMDPHDCTTTPMCECPPCPEVQDFDPSLPCNYISKNCGSSTFSAPTTVPTPPRPSTRAIPIPTITLLIQIPTIDPLVSTSTTSSLPLPPASTSLTSPPTASAVPMPPAQHNRALVYMAIPLTVVPLLVLAVVCFVRRHRMYRKPIHQDGLPGLPTAQTSMRGGGPPARFGGNERAWTGKGYREYRISGSTMPSSGGSRVVSGGGGGNKEKGGSRVTAWLGE